MQPEYHGPDLGALLLLAAVMFVFFGAALTLLISENASNFDNWHRALSDWWSSRKRQKLEGNRYAETKDTNRS